MAERTRPIRVLLEDDDESPRDALGAMLSEFDDIDEVAVASYGAAFTEAYVGEPDVVLLAAPLNDRSLVHVTRNIPLVHEPATVCLLAEPHAERRLGELLMPAIWAGANGYLLRSEPIDVLHAAIHHMATAGAIVSPRLAHRLLDQYYLAAAAAGSEMPDSALDKSERRMLEWTAGGLTVAEAAKAIDSSERAIDAYPVSALTKIRAFVPELPDLDDLFGSGDRAPRPSPGWPPHVSAAKPLPSADDDELLALLPRSGRAFPADWPPHATES